MNNHELYTEESCCGCGACAVRCPRNAISLEENEYGFIYPQIDEKLCIDCGACKNICVFSKGKESNDFECYACANKDDELIMKSASGGAFSAIAYNFIEAGGYVCGATAVVKDGRIFVEHIMINCVNDLYKLQGSKYVQSSTVSAFQEIQILLKKGERVLFSGTPCQVDAIKSLCKKYVGQTLFTIDIICHGVPSQKFLNGYLYEYQKRKKSSIVYIDFRNKMYGWGKTGIAVFQNNDTDIITMENSSYYNLFMESEVSRDNCYKCPYANLNRIGDVTVGDYWGAQDFSSELINDNMLSEKKGISCLLVNNDIGKKMISDFGKKLTIYPVEKDKIITYNTQLREPAKHTAIRDKVLNTFAEKGYKPIEKSFIRKLRIKKMKKLMKDMVPKKVKDTIKVMIGKNR